MMLERLWSGLGWVVLVAGLSGCRSAYVVADVKNATDKPVSLVEVDYPSASFGVQTLAAGAEYHYRFKIIGTGTTQILWTDAAEKQHTVKGPELREGQQGPLGVTILSETAVWATALKP